jgi:hypothetical protein
VFDRLQCGDERCRRHHHFWRGRIVLVELLRDGRLLRNLQRRLVCSFRSGAGATQAPISGFRYRLEARGELALTLPTPQVTDFLLIPYQRADSRNVRTPKDRFQNDVSKPVGD